MPSPMYLSMMRRHAFAQAGEPLQIAEHDGHYAALTFCCRQDRAVDQTFGNAGIDVFSECLPDTPVVARS